MFSNSFTTLYLQTEEHAQLRKDAQRMRCEKSNLLLYRVVHSPRVAIRDAPSLSGRIMSSKVAGEQVVGSAIVNEKWLQLSPMEENSAKDRDAFMLIDGKELSLGQLLERI